MARYDSLVYFDSGVTYDEPDTPTVIQPTHMMDLHKFLTNPFDDPGISMDELLAFTTDHLQKITANNPGGIYTARLAATNTALGGVGSAFTDDQTKLGLRKARKQAKDAFRSALPKNISPLAVAVEAKFGEGSPEFVECFPQGRAVFTRCTDDKVANHLQTLINGVTAHQALLGAPVVASATALLTGWNAVYAPSESASGAKTTTEAAKSAARGALQLELFKNLLTIALNNPRLPDNLDNFMQQSLLEDHPVTPPSPPPPGP
jgi:hypothetical protein